MKLRISLNPSWRRPWSTGDRRFWLLSAAAFTIDIRTDPLWLVEIYFKRLLVAVAILGLTLHLAGAAGLALWLNRDPHNQVRWADLALPWRWDGLAKKRGDGAIARGLANLRQRNFDAAHAQFRLGLGRSPANLEGRVQLARLVAAYEPTHALQLLEEGLPYAAANPDYWRGLVGMYQFNEAYARGLAALERALAGSAAQQLPADQRDNLITARARLLLNAGRSADALQALESAPASATLAPTERDARNVIEATALTALGRASEALTRIDRERAAIAKLDPEYLRAEAAACVATHAEDRLRRVLLQLRAAEPGNPAAYAHAYDCWHRLGRISYCDQVEADFYQHFARDDHALQVFALMLAGLGDQDALARARKNAMASRLSPFAFDVRLTEASLRRGDLPAARQRLREWEDKLPRVPREQSFDPEFIRRLVHAVGADTDGAAGALLRHLQEHRAQARPEHYRFAVDCLARVGQLDPADQLLKQAQDHFALSDPLVTTRRELEAKLAAETGVGLSQVSPTADTALAVIDEQLAQNSLVEARASLQSIRRANPPWLAGSLADFELREIEWDLAANGATADRGRVRKFLENRSIEQAAIPLLDLCRKLFARQQSVATQLLRDEIKVARGDSPAVAAALEELAKMGNVQIQFADSAAAFRTLDAWMNAGHWDDADQLMKQWQQHPQAWAETAPAELLARRVRVGLGVGRKPIALVDFRALAMSAGEWRAAAFRLVREYAARGERDTARMLALEADRALPGDQEVAGLLGELRSSALPADR